MKTVRNQLLVAAAAAGVIGMAAAVRANTYTWVGSTADWNTSTNWTPTGGPPTAADTAIFSGATSNTAVTLSGTGNALGIGFNGSTGYTVGTTTGPAIDLASGGYVNLQSSDTASQSVNAPIVIGGNESFTNDASGSANTLAVGGSVTGTAGAAATDTLTLTGTNTGANAVNGVIADGSGGGNVAVAATGGSWTLGGVNTYSGGTTVDNGASLEYTNTAAFGPGTITIGVGSGSATYGTLVAGVGGTLANNITTVAPGYTGSDVFNTNGVTTTLTGKINSGGWKITGGGTLIYATSSNSGEEDQFVTGGSTLEVASGGYFGNGNLSLTDGHFVSGNGVVATLAGFNGDSSSSISIATANSGVQNLNGTALNNGTDPHGNATQIYAGAITGAGSFIVDRQYTFASGSTTIDGASALTGFTGTLGVNYDGILNVSLVTGLSGNAVEFTGGAYNGSAAATTEILYLNGTGQVALGAVSMAIGNPWGSGFTGSSAVNTIDAGGTNNTVTISGAISSSASPGNPTSLVLQDGKFALAGGITSGAVQVASTGTLSNINFTLGSGGSLAGSGTLTWNLSGNSGDLLTDNGTLNITNLNLVLNMTGTQTFSQYVLVDYAGGTLTGTAFASVTGLQPGWTLDYSGTALNPSSIVLSRVPEPGALALLAVGGLGLVLLGRKRRSADM